MGITSWERRSGNDELGHTLSYTVARCTMRILELESRCAVIRTVGSNPTLSVPTPYGARDREFFQICTTNCTTTKPLLKVVHS